MKSIKTSMKVVIPIILLASIFVVASAATNVQPAKEAQTAVPDLYSDAEVGLDKEAQTAVPDRIAGLTERLISDNLGGS